MNSLPSYYRNPIQTANEQLNRPPQGELKPIESPVYNAGSFLEDRAGMPNAGRIVQRIGAGSYGEIDPAQAVRGVTEIAMQVPQFKTTGAAVQTAGSALRPALQSLAQQGVKSALPTIAKAMPKVGVAVTEGMALAGSLTGNDQLADLAAMGRAGTRGLSALTRREIDIGEEGARNLAAARNNQNLLKQLASAKRLYDRGISNESVFKQTGWRQLPGQEGASHWAYEVSDNAAQLKPNAQSGMLASQYVHPDLMDAYPELGFMQRVANPNLPKGVAGKKLSDRIEYNPDLLTTPESQKRNLTHEMQHWIQDVEGWPKGSSPRAKEAQDYAEQQARNELENQGLSSIKPPDLAELQRMLALQHYYNQAGEAQARMAADRINLTQEQRRSNFPNYDRTAEELRYRY